MNWLDVAGPPGSGKSTICYEFWADKEITSDGELPPIEWHDFLNETTRLLGMMAPHQKVFVPELGRCLDFFIPAVRMNLRSWKKMAAVARMPADERGPFMQTGFVQRGLGFGWRLHALGGNLNEIRHYFRLMPVSLGVVFLRASRDTIEARNRERLNNPETAHEDRTYQVKYMAPAIEVAKDELSKRSGFGIYDINVDCEIETSRLELKTIAKTARVHPHKKPLSGETVYSPPSWWQ